MSQIEIQIAGHLLQLGWKREVNYGGEVEFTSPDSEYQITFQDDWWQLGKFTDSDIDDVAVGRYETAGEGQTFEELKAALALPALTVNCEICRRPALASTAHLHQGKWIGDDCCWDERLRVTS